LVKKQNTHKHNIKTGQFMMILMMIVVVVVAAAAGA
jgi:hypothetical protein